MSDVSSEKKKNRKLKSPEEKQKPPKKLRSDGPNKQNKPIEVQEAESSKRLELEVTSPWSNLQLILSIQNKEIELHTKVELAFQYVSSRWKGGDTGIHEDDNATVKLPRLVSFLNDWIQSLLISTDKKVSVDGGKQQPWCGLIEMCLYYKCWVIFRFCLEKGLTLQVSLSLSKNLLRTISSVARKILSLLGEKSVLIGEGFEFYSVVLDCVSMVFLSHGGLSNENLDLWISTVSVVLKLVCKVYEESIEGGDVGIFSLRLSCLVLEQFAKFLRVHPTRKNGFRDFVDQLLEPLLHLLGVLHLHVDGSNPSWMGNLLFMTEEVLTQGLFHPTHVDGFLSLHGTEKYRVSADGEMKNLKTVIKSYHRHLFDKLDRILAAKKESTLSGFGELFHFLVNRVKKQKGTSALSMDTEMAGNTAGSRHLSDDISIRLYWNGSTPPENSYGHNKLNAAKRKSLLDFFVLIMEPFLLEMNGYLQTKFEVCPLLLDAYCMLKSITNLLASLSHEKLYVKTEDISEGACLNFLKKVYTTIFAFSTKVLCLPTHGMGAWTQERQILLARELLVAVGFLLDIEYEVIENDLTSLWLMLLSYMALGYSFKDTVDISSLTSQIFGLGCQLVKLYGDLRQVKNTIFALCKAIRLVTVHHSNGLSELNYDTVWSCPSSKSSEVYAKSVRMLLCAQEFKLAIHNVIKSTPEGQASECIRELSADLSDSIEWMKINWSAASGHEFGESNERMYSTHCFYQQAELFGRGLSEMYALVLDSLTVTVGNSSLVGRSITDLMTVIRPYMSLLVGPDSDSGNEFFSCVIGTTSDVRLAGNRTKFHTSIHWVFMFFFRLYMSCRSLCRQAIGLMPPDASGKMSAAIGDSNKACSGRRWMEITNWKNEGYFSWIVQPSASLLVIIQSVSDICLEGSSSTVDCSPLIFLLFGMVLQRLVDLNRQVKSLEYVQQSNDNTVKHRLLDDAGLSLYRKRSRKWRRNISRMKQEAVDLTEFMLNYSSLFGNDQLKATSDGGNYVGDPTLYENSQWVLDACSVDKQSLPAAIWWIVCKNIDIWSIHASKKKLKMFLSQLIHTSLPFKTGEAGLAKKMSLCRISSELLTDSILYEHKFVRRHFASSFCRLLGKSVLPLFGGPLSVDINLNQSLNCQEILSSLKDSSAVVLDRNHATFNKFSEKKSAPGLPFESPASISEVSTGMRFTACQDLLSLFCWMPKAFITSRSFSLYATHMLNLERLVIHSLLESQDALSPYNRYELLRLLLSCRRAVKHLVVAYCEEKAESNQSSLTPMLSKGSILWLFMSLSVVVGLQETLPEHSGDEVTDILFSLMDHTSYVFLTLGRYECAGAVHSIVADKPDKHQPSCKIHQETSSLNDSDSRVDSLQDIEAWESVLVVAETLKEQTEGLLISLKEATDKEKVGDGINRVNLSELSSIVSCLSGFLWGVSSAFNCINGKDSDYKVKLKCEPVSRINLCINMFRELIDFSLYALFSEDVHQPRKLCDASNSVKSEESEDSSGLGHAGAFPVKGFTDTSILCSEQPQNSGGATTRSASSNICNDSKNASMYKHSLQLESANSVAIILDKLGSYECQSLNKFMLKGLLNDHHPKAKNLIRQLFIASSAILRLNLQTRYTTLLSSLVPNLMGTSQVLLLRLAEGSEVLEPFSFVWLDGVLKYLQELGDHFPFTNPTLTRSIYTNLIELHLKALGKCISLQGKEATLASHERESSTKILQGHIESSGISISHRIYGFNDFKARLRMSFQVLVKKPSELHLLSAIQAIERALVGVHDGCTKVYEINTGSADGGKVSSTVAAGVDCLDLVLEHISGRKRLSVIKRHIQSLIAALFNIILHLQSPSIFYAPSTGCKGGSSPDPGAVILMCVEVLTRVSGKHALFEMDSWHVAQCLHIPSALFQDFDQLRISQDPLLSNSLLLCDKQDCDPAVGMNSNVVDRQFSVELFAACCRLLYTILKHHRSESERCIALLQEATRVLLHCLELVDADLLIKKGYFSWGLQEGVKCACLLRRIYEELRQQKDVFGRHCFKFLFNYIWVYSGYGPLKTGIRREIDEALKPGVHALVDACSADDLQYMHSAFGEGPCRNTLAALQHDYKLNFHYEGKV